MPYYTISLDKFRITCTRARHNDTDEVTFSLKVGDRDPAVLKKSMGDVNDGEHLVGLKFEAVPIADGTPVVFNYVIANAGYPDTADAVKKKAEEAADAMIKKGIEALPGGKYWEPVVDYFVKWVVEKFVELVYPNCDGLVAADQINATGRDLRNWTSNNPHYTEPERFYPGYNSSDGCGDNSKYYVTWSVTRERGEFLPLASVSALLLGD